MFYGGNPCTRGYYNCKWIDYQQGIQYRKPMETAILLPTLRLYPNPTSGTVHLVWYNIESGEGEAVLKDGLGRVVYQKAIDFVSQEVDLSLEALPSGVYYLTVTCGGIPVGTEKLIVTE